MGFRVRPTHTHNHMTTSHVSERVSDWVRGFGRTPLHLQSVVARLKSASAEKCVGHPRVWDTSVLAGYVPSTVTLLLTAGS